MSESEEHSTNNPTAPMALAHQAMEENTCRFCQAIPEENVSASHRRPFKVARNTRDGKYSFYKNHRQTILGRLFAAYGLPEQVVTDNGPQFVSQIS